MAGKIEQTEQALTDSVTQAEHALTALRGVVESEEGAGGLPEGWESSSLKDLFQFVIGGDWGKAPDFVDENFKEVFCIRGSEFKNWKTDYGSTSVPRKIKSSSLETRKLQEGDILVEISGGGPDQPVGRTVLIENHVVSQFESPVVCTNFLRLTRPFLSVNSKYLNGYLTSFYMSGEVTKYQGGSNNLRNLKFKEFETIQIPLPPLAEQTIIAQTLDTLLAQVDNIKTRLDAIPKILKTFRQSVLAAAVSGKLTEAWRGESECERSFKTLGDAGVNVKTGPFGSALHKADYIEGGIPVINPMHINDGLISPSSSMTVKDEKYEDLKAWHLKWGDVIVGRRGEMGRAAVFKSDDKMLCGTGSMVLRGDDNVSSEYLCIILRSPTAIAYFVQGSVGSTMVNLNQKIIKALDVYFPPIKEQTEIVNRVEELFSFADQIEQQVKNAQGRVNNLTQSILAKAFRGELTAEWRAENADLITGENSAEALLAKIQEEREALKKSAKPKKTAKKKAVVKKSTAKKTTEK